MTLSLTVLNGRFCDIPHAIEEKLYGSAQRSIAQRAHHDM